MLDAVRCIQPSAKPRFQNDILRLFPAHHPHEHQKQIFKIRRTPQSFLLKMNIWCLNRLKCLQEQCIVCFLSIKGKTLRHAYQMRRRKPRRLLPGFLQNRIEKRADRPFSIRSGHMYDSFLLRQCIQVWKHPAKPLRCMFFTGKFRYLIQICICRFYRPFFLSHGMKYPFLANGSGSTNSAVCRLVFCMLLFYIICGDHASGYME